MTLINSTLIFGLVLATVPVILHMVMRARPKRIEFPALRLLKARQPSNSRRMQLRHLLLLILRSLVIAILVIAIARPSLPAARYGLRWWEWAILATAIAGSTAAYFLFAARGANRDTALVDHRERKGRLRLWCLLSGIAATLIGVGIP
jgi:sterol desaturase/sphingolipid hydroxylase (fatty acid hydroxylase superfamily)